MFYDTMYDKCLIECFIFSDSFFPLFFDTPRHLNQVHKLQSWPLHFGLNRHGGILAFPCWRLASEVNFGSWPTPSAQGGYDGLQL
jgi:hypothetical protein